MGTIISLLLLRLIWVAITMAIDQYFWQRRSGKFSHQLISWEKNLNCILGRHAGAGIAGFSGCFTRVFIPAILYFLLAI